jgi:hypothetical protein
LVTDRTGKTDFPPSTVDVRLVDGALLRLGWQGNPYADNVQYLNSLVKLERFQPDGKPFTSFVRRPIQAAPFATVEYRRKMFGRAASPWKQRSP